MTPSETAWAARRSTPCSSRRRSRTSSTGSPRTASATRFGDIVRANIAQLNGGDTALAATLTDVLLPDLLSYEVGDSSGFLNGRRLADDVIDAELNLLTKGAVTGDGVANDSAFTTTFPYLAAANAN